MSPERMHSRAVTAAAFIKAGWLIWAAALALAIIYPGADDILVGLYAVALFHLLRYNYWAWNGNEKLNAKAYGRPAKTWPPYIGIVNIAIFVVFFVIGRYASRPVRLALFFLGFASATFWLRACCNAFRWWVRDQIAADAQDTQIRDEPGQQEKEMDDTVRGNRFRETQRAVVESST